MNLSKIVTILLILGFFGYLIFLAPKVERPTQSTSATISGVVINHIGDTIKFYAPDSTYITVLDTATGVFAIEFEWDTASNVNFFHGMESTKMYLQPGDDIKLTIDTEQFDETGEFAVRDGEKNEREVGENVGTVAGENDELALEGVGVAMLIYSVDPFAPGFTVHGSACC